MVVSDILSERSHYGKKERDKTYYLKDLFCYFYIKLFNGKTFNLKLLHNEQLKGFAFEILVQNNIELIKKHIGRQGFTSTNYSWKNKNAQIDLILDYGNNSFSLFEVKYYDNIYELDTKANINILTKKNEFLNSIKRVKKEMDVYIVSLSGTKNKDGHLYYKDVLVFDLLD